MKKNLKYIWLIIIILFLTGCGWEDVQNEYGEYFGLSCKYVNNNAIDGLTNFEVGLTEKEAYVEYNGKHHFYLINSEDETNLIHSFDNVKIHHYDQSVELFLDTYISNNQTCPSQIYVFKESTLDNYFVMRPDSCSSGNNCYSYSYQTNASSVLDEKGRPCTHKDATSCKKYAIEYDQDNAYLDETIFFELGKTATGKYFTVCDNKNYDSQNGGCATKLVNFAVDGLSLGDNKYYINEEDVDLIFSGQNFPANEELTVKWTPNGGYKGAVYHIFHKDSENNFLGDELETKDPGDVINPMDQMTPLKPNELNCNSLLGSTICPAGKNCEPAFYLQIVFDVMKYVAIIIVIVFSILDFTGAVASQDNDILKKSVKKLMIRLILCVVIFVLPTILEFVFTLINVYSPSTCGIN